MKNFRRREELLSGSSKFSQTRYAKNSRYVFTISRFIPAYILTLSNPEFRQRPPSSGDDLLSLKTMLFEYGSQKFKSNFGFSFEGSQSSPPDRRPGGAVRGYEELMQTTNYPTSVVEVESWLNAEVFLFVFFCIDSGTEITDGGRQKR
jgi:hypothetical protein